MSRKTARDGRLEIPPELAATVRALAPHFTIHVGSQAHSGALVSMECACRGRSGHRHHFLEAEGLKQLPAGMAVVASVAGGEVTVSPAGETRGV